MASLDLAGVRLANQCSYRGFVGKPESFSTSAAQNESILCHFAWSFLLGLEPDLELTTDGCFPFYIEAVKLRINRLSCPLKSGRYFGGGLSGIEMAFREYPAIDAQTLVEFTGHEPRCPVVASSSRYKTPPTTS